MCVRGMAKVNLSRRSCRDDAMIVNTITIMHVKIEFNSETVPVAFPTTQSLASIGRSFRVASPTTLKNVLLKCRLSSPLMPTTVLRRWLAKAVVENGPEKTAKLEGDIEFRNVSFN